MSCTFLHPLCPEDGTKPSPVNHGPSSSAAFLQDAARVCQEFMARDPAEFRFTIVALTATNWKLVCHFVEILLSVLWNSLLVLLLFSPSPSQGLWYNLLLSALRALSRLYRNDIINPLVRIWRTPLSYSFLLWPLLWRSCSSQLSKLTSTLLLAHDRAVWALSFYSANQLILKCTEIGWPSPIQCLYLDGITR